MKNFFYILGKSSTGKDTIYKRLLCDPDLSCMLQTITPYTTRPMREGEMEGREYFFKKEKEFLELKQKGLILEERTYNTTKGAWTYFTPMDDAFIKADGADIITVGVIKQFIAIRNKIRENGFPINPVPIYIEVDEGERIIRAIKREQKKPNPDYNEICRRVLESDGPDFTEELLKEAEVNRFENKDLNVATSNIKEFILKIKNLTGNNK